MLILRKQLPQWHFPFPVLLILLRVVDTNVCTMDHMHNVWCIGDSGVVCLQTFRVWKTLRRDGVVLMTWWLWYAASNECVTLLSEQLILPRIKDVWKKGQW